MEHRRTDRRLATCRISHQAGTPSPPREPPTAQELTINSRLPCGGLGADDPAASPHLRSRRETGERLAVDGVPVTTLRAAIVIGPGSAAFETILGLVKRLPVMITPSWASTPTQPIALSDIARYLAGVAGKATALSIGYDVGGADLMTYRQGSPSYSAGGRGSSRCRCSPRRYRRCGWNWSHRSTPR